MTRKTTLIWKKGGTGRELTDAVVCIVEYIIIMQQYVCTIITNMHATQAAITHNDDN